MKLSAALIGSTMAVDHPQPSSAPVNPVEAQGTKKPFKNIHVKDDMYYSPSHLNHLERQGVDTSDFSGAIQHGARESLSGRGLEGGAREWYQTDADGYLVVPYSHTADYPEPDKLIAGMDGMTNDLMPCMRMEYVPRDQLSSTQWEHGIMFGYNQGSCWSWVGLVPGAGEQWNDNSYITNAGGPPNWQMIGMDDGCGGRTAGTIHHEVLHALGFGHEHNRPDRDQHLNVYLDRSSMASQYQVINHWIEHEEYPFEVESVLTYCSYCSARGSQPVAELKDGRTFSGGDKMTTTDALQTQKRYCQSKQDNYTYKEHVQCTSTDLLGFTRPIFSDKLCDNNYDCPGQEDEGELVNCIPFGQNTANGCCESYFYRGNEYALEGQWQGYDYYANVNEADSFLIYYASRNTWYLDTTDGLMNWQGWSFQESVTPAGSDGSCPPKSHVACKVSGPELNNFCADNNCDPNATCSNTLDAFTCSCNEGYKGDGMSCEALPVQDECALGSHDCHDDATCTDTQYSYECACNSGTKDNSPDPDNFPGRKCKGLGCCRVWEINWNDSWIFECTHNPDKTGRLGGWMYDCPQVSPYALSYAPLGGEDRWCITNWDINGGNSVSYYTYATNTGPDAGFPCMGDNVQWTSGYKSTCLESYETEDTTTDAASTTEAATTSTYSTTSTEGTTARWTTPWPDTTEATTSEATTSEATTEEATTSEATTSTTEAQTTSTTTDAETTSTTEAPTTSEATTSTTEAATTSTTEGGTTSTTEAATTSTTEAPTTEAPTTSTVTETTATGSADTTASTTTTAPITTGADDTTAQPETTSGEATTSTGATTSATTTEAMSTTTVAPTPKPTVKPVVVKVTVKFTCKYAWSDDFLDTSTALYKMLENYILDLLVRLTGLPRSSFSLTIKPPTRKRRALGEGFEFEVETVTTENVPMDASAAEAEAVAENIASAIENDIASHDFENDEVTSGAEVASVGTESVDCYINNGGCSHTCDRSGDAHYCRCPNCWEMGEDQLNCRPMSQYLQTTCLPNAMEITMHKCVLEGSHDFESASMSDGDCAFVKNDDRLTVTMNNPLGECGMQLDYDSSTEEVIYSNKMTIAASRLNSMIVTEPDIEWGFTCKYETDYTVQGDATISSASLDHQFGSENGQFSFDFKFYETESFEVEQTDAAYKVGQQINFGLIMNENVKLDKLEFVATACTVSAGDQSYQIWDYENMDKCLPDQYIAFARYGVTDAFAKYSYTGFQFRPDGVSSPDDQAISCAVKVCHEDDMDSVCKSGCYGI